MHLLLVGKADSHLLLVGKADSHSLPPVLATKLGTINWSSQFLRFSGILRKTPVGIADAGTEIRFRSSESVPVFGTSGEWAACLSPFHRFASAFREGSGERLFSKKPQTVKKLGRAREGRSPFELSIVPSGVYGGHGAIFAPENPIFQRKNRFLAVSAPEKSLIFSGDW